MNVLMLLKNKSEVSYIYDTFTFEQGLEAMKEHGYTAIPVLSKDEKYVGCVSVSDFLWSLVDYMNNKVKSEKPYLVKDIIKKNYNPAVRVDVKMDELLNRSMSQNFIPVKDDRDYFIGIVTRQDIIRSFVGSTQPSESNA